MSTGFIMTTQTIRICHPHGVRAAFGGSSGRSFGGAPRTPRPAPAAAPAGPRRASCTDRPGAH
ncbi:hypothetical protein EGY31_31980 [Burkholderia multivorans]|nr:hypothetical protein EGY31_31980 [Burkholderia multivorans]